MNLVDVIAARTPAAPVTQRTATVTAVTGDTLTLSIAGATLTGIPKMASYAAPAVDDVVLVMQSGAQLIALGPVGEAAEGTYGGGSGSYVSSIRFGTD